MTFLFWGEAFSSAGSGSLELSVWVMHVNDMCIIGRNLYGCADLHAHERFSILFIELMCLRSNLVSAWKAMQFHRLHALTSSWYEIGVVCYLSNSHPMNEFDFLHSQYGSYLYLQQGSFIKNSIT